MEKNIKYLKYRYITIYGPSDWYHDWASNIEKWLEKKLNENVAPKIEAIEYEECEPSEKWLKEKISSCVNERERLRWLQSEFESELKKR